MGKEIYNIINDMAEVLNASQMQKLQEVLINRLSENNTVDYLQTGNEEFLDMFLTRYSKNSPTSLGGEMNCKKYERTLVLRRRMWYNIISRIKERIDYNMDLDNNAHSVFLLYYHLIMVVKYRRKVIDDVISNRCELRNQHS